MWGMTPPTVTVEPLITNVTTPTITGMVDDANATVKVTVNGDTYQATVYTNTWGVDITNALAEGTYNVQAIATDAAGNVGYDNTTDEVVIEATQPVTPTVTPTVTVTPTTSDATVAFGATTYQVPEQDGNVILSVIRTGNTQSMVTVNYVTANGSATAGADYTATTGTLTFAAGETVTRITVPIVDDTAYEGDETFIVTVTSSDRQTTLDTATVTIVDNDEQEPNPMPTEYTTFIPLVQR
jgi:hypothetical protein